MRLCVFTCFVLAAGVSGATAASFDCAKASSPFEHAICDNAELSAADERLAKTYQTAIGGLSDNAVAAVKTDQRGWLDYAQKACTRDAKPLTSGSYPEDGVSCLVSTFNARSSVLETSRMIDGHRFYPQSQYSVAVDPDGVGQPDYTWPLATHEFSYLQLDGDDAVANGFNTFVNGEVADLSGSGTEVDDTDSTSDTSNSISFKELAGDKRITLDVETYWYGHGAAHGNYTISYLHYLTDEGRALNGSDLFSGKGWQKALLTLTVDALRREHGDNLMLDNPKDIADIVTDPTRWDLSDPYGLVIQFNPYEVSAYAYGAPTARVSWSDLESYLSPDADSVRYGY